MRAERKCNDTWILLLCLLDLCQCDTNYNYLREGNLIWEIAIIRLAVDKIVEHFLNQCGWAHPTGDGSSPGFVVLGAIRKQADEPSSLASASAPASRFQPYLSSLSEL